MLPKYWVMTFFGVLLLVVLFFLSEMKNAYKVIPIKESPVLVATPYLEWKDFTSQSGKFVVSFPVPPQNAKDVVNVPRSDLKRTYDMYVSEKNDGTIFMVSVITYPKELVIANSNFLLDEVVDEMMQTNPKNRLLKKEASTYNGMPAIDFKIDNKIYDIEGKVIANNEVIYLLSYLAKKGKFDADEYHHFIDSFKLTDKLTK